MLQIYRSNAERTKHRPQSTSRFDINLILHTQFFKILINTEQTESNVRPI